MEGLSAGIGLWACADPIKKTERQSEFRMVNPEHQKRLFVRRVPSDDD